MFQNSINTILRKLFKSNHIIIIYFISFFILNFLGEYLGAIFYNLQRGLLYYSVGAYLRIKKNSYKKQIIYILSFFLLLFSYGILQTLKFDMMMRWNELSIYNKLFFYISRLTESIFLEPFSSIFLFIFFSKKKEFYSKIINLISSTTLDIYLLHTANFISYILYIDIFNIIEKYEKPSFILYANISIVGIFILTSIIGVMYNNFLESYFIKKFNAFKRIFIEIEKNN